MLKARDLGALVAMRATQHLLLHRNLYLPANGHCNLAIS